MESYTDLVLHLQLVCFFRNEPLYTGSNLIYNTSETHERHECNSSNTSETRVQHNCDTSATRTTRVRRECYTNDTSENFDFGNATSKNIYSHSFIYYMRSEWLQGEKQFHSKNYLLEMPHSHAKIRLKSAPKKLDLEW